MFWLTEAVSKSRSDIAKVPMGQIRKSRKNQRVQTRKSCLSTVTEVSKDEFQEKHYIDQ